MVGVYKSFIILNRNECALDDKHFNSALNKFIIVHTTPGTAFSKRMPCYNKIAEGKYIFPKASAKLLVEHKLVNSADEFKIMHCIGDVAHSTWQMGNKMQSYDSVKLDLTPNQFIILSHIKDRELSINKANRHAATGRVAGCVAVAGAGTGKTRLGLALIKMLGYRGLVIVPSNKTIMYQWLKECDRVFDGNIIVGGMTGMSTESASAAVSLIKDGKQAPLNEYNSNRHIKITLLGDGYKDTSGDIVIAMVSSLLNTSPLQLQKFGVTVIDECHSYCTPEYSKVFWMFQSPITVGLTATPSERIDGFDKMLSMHLGPQVICRNIPGYSIDFETEKSKFDVTVIAIKFRGHSDFTQRIVNKEGQVRIPETITALLHDPYRNSLILRLLHNLMLERRHTFVFSDRKEHCRYLERAFIAVYGGGSNASTSDEDSELPDGIDDSADNSESDGENTSKPNDSAFYIMIGGSKKETLDKSASEAKCGTIIFTTHSYCRQAIDIPYMDTEICVAPRRNGTTQLVGRITRYGGDIAVPRRVYDIVDVCSTVRTQYDSGKTNRVKKYKEHGFKIVEVEKKWEEYEDETQKRISLLAAST